ncbi:ATP-dependent DNA helicase RecQ [Microcystis aeruginosa NIES-1211]|uniref:DNA helicase RecQ n=1 Tax=Microcystis aeruginosa NIES-2519 TaxID=2303981 RepID=A0A5A5RIQ5_MICAE|nr:MULTISPECIES: DNA helicase RecQ [Microcystis]AVQ71471.1 DNA helicase RecQ [Microcystis sp. MC19]GBL15087.1 ATP-dependent DNA helicase RecQ [Microcystis aeruginosa NIES-1211]GCA72226.1 ATP-dependent DNA helicase RecQ [Microcystis aeruginosa NIES-2519]GCA86484.1 ATP-dependent DNA helicase RecQ [Microcystis aeruginosa NIES-2522]GCA89315.1 ATP-dependent DNA helicase RecQ [Microcystis aeruginosa NIES-4264]
MAAIDSLEKALKYHFGYDQFRPNQRQIIEAALNNQDLLVIMPTGGGKSLCFQLPALIKKGVTVVVSPLIALMQDQVTALADNGIGATFLNSTLNAKQVRERESLILQGKIKLLYVAPERLLSPSFLDFLAVIDNYLGLACLAVDEAHCVSDWGHDFRPEYRQIKQVRQRFPSVPILALTATATQQVREDIIQQLGLRDTSIHTASFNRPNLYYEVQPKTSKSYQQLYQYIKGQKGSGIVYCISRKTVDKVAEQLQKDGIDALPYHAGMDDRERSENQTRFIRDDVQIMVATIAFGMGINKPDVRFVVHYDLPRNLEGYYQESGRAGRDGEPAKCTLFFSFADARKIEYFINQKTEQNEQQKARQQLRQVLDYAEGTECRRSSVLGYFGESFAGNCGNCDNCRNGKNNQDWTIEAQKFLSCVARTGQKFGMMHIINVLRGRKGERISQYQHHLLSTYGIGKDKTVEEWKRLSRSLVQQNILVETEDDFRILKLNQHSWEVMRKQRSVFIAVPQKANGQIVGDDNPNMVESDLLFERLRQLRKKIADSQGVPPYVIFHDSSLRLMAQSKPRNLGQFRQISGVVHSKVQQYGDIFIAAINDFCQDSLPSTQFLTLQYYQDGLNAEEIARKRSLKVSTIYEHLAKLLEAGYEIDINQLVSKNKQEYIRLAIKKVGDQSLKTLKENLGDNYSYEEIKLVVAWQRRPRQ